MRPHATPLSRRQTVLAAISMLAASAVLLALLWLLNGAPVTAAPSAELHVCPGGPPTCDHATVQAAVDAAGPGDVIKIATGVYTGVQARAGITQVVYISKTVTLRGGYTTADWNSSDPVANPTTLDAQDLGRVLVISGAITPTVEGLRITGGNATGLEGGGDDGEDDAGGGMYVYTATATISGCVIVSNTASTTSRGYGGGLYLYSSAATLQDNTVQGNIASTAEGGYGGGLCLEFSAATLKDNTVQENIATTVGWGSGGGLYLFLSPATLQDNTIVGNIAGTTGWSTGGGLYLGASAATLQGNKIISNTAGIWYGLGGGLYGGALMLQDNTIVGNTASAAHKGYGGGGYIVESKITLRGNTVQNNTASAANEGVGGGLYIIQSLATLEGNVVAGNTASTVHNGDGGGLYLWENFATLRGNTIVSNTATLSPTAIGRGGGVLVEGGRSFTLTNNLVAGNHANTEGGGLWFKGESWAPSGQLLHNTIANNHGSEQGVYVGDDTTLAFTNTIIAGHSVGITVTAGSTATLEGTLWHANGTDTAGAGTILTGTLNIDGDPAFVNPAAWDYHLSPGSPAIDAGMNAGIAEDIDGETRPADDGYDIGADEFWWKRLFPLMMRDYDASEWLLNPGFEGITCRPGSVPPECLDNWTRDTHDGSVHDNIFTPQGWVTWWREGGNTNCSVKDHIPLLSGSCK